LHFLLASFAFLACLICISCLPHLHFLLAAFECLLAAFIFEKIKQERERQEKGREKEKTGYRRYPYKREPHSKLETQSISKYKTDGMPQAPLKRERPPPALKNCERSEQFF